LLKLLDSVARIVNAVQHVERTDYQTAAQTHLKSARHGGVFHFLPDRFAEAIANTPMTECVFMSSRGEKRGNLHYDFADLITAEMMVGTRLDDSAVAVQMMDNMLKFVGQFVEHSENFIADQLGHWGFEVRPSS
jgi:hypothetical protein